MRRFARITSRILIGVLIGLALILGAIAILVRTDIGREGVRRVVVARLDHVLAGELTIRRLTGNMLVRVTLIDVELRDAQGRPFIRADTISGRVSVRALFQRRIVLSSLRLVHADVVLDQPPRESWNFARILRLEERTPGPPGWGDWIDLSNVQIVDSNVIVRSEWQPDPALPPAQQQAAIAQALSADSRQNVQQVPGGYQRVMRFLDIDALIPRAIVADPEPGRTRVEVASLSTIALPFRPPPAEIEDLSGIFRFTADSLWFEQGRARLPGSVLSGRFAYHQPAGDWVLDVRGQPFAFADLQWLYPPLPPEGGGSMHLRLHDREFTTVFTADEIDVQVEGATIEGRLSMMVGDTLRFYDTDLRLVNLDTRLIERVFPYLDMPRHGLLTGTLALDGPPAALQASADLIFIDEQVGFNHVIASGGLDTEGELQFRDMRFRFEPLQSDLARDFVWDGIPAGGTIEGVAVLDGPVGGPLHVDADLVLRDPATGTSRILALGVLDPIDGAVEFSDMRLEFRPLQSDLALQIVPGVPPGGTVIGQLRLDGVTAGILRLDGDLTVNDPVTGVSRLLPQGALDLAGPPAFQDMFVRLDPLQLDFVRQWLEELPPGGTVRGDLVLNGPLQGNIRVVGEVEVAAPGAGVSVLTSVGGGIQLQDVVSFHDLDLRLHPLQFDLVRGYAPQLPPGGTATGPVLLDGPALGVFYVNGDVVIDDPATGRSRVGATGSVQLVEGPIFHGLELRFDPVQVDLAERFIGELPIGGIATGTVFLVGAPGDYLLVRGEIEHLEAGELSRVAGSVEFTPGEWIAANLDLLPLSLFTAGRFAPAAALHGAVSGRVMAEGRLEGFALQAGLAVHGDGQIAVAGMLDLASPEPGYDVLVRLADFDLAAVTARAPATTSLTGTIVAEGRGVDPATMLARIEADLTGPRVDEVAADLVHLRLAIADGVAYVDSALVLLDGAEARARGSFGLVAGRWGELAYQVRIDSLHALAPYLPPTDTTLIVRGPSPWVPTPADSLAGVPPAAAPAAPIAAQPLAVAPEPVIAGQPPERTIPRVAPVPPVPSAQPLPPVPQMPPLPTLTPLPPATDPAAAPVPPTVFLVPAPPIPDTALSAPIAAESLAGSLLAEGVLRGNVQVFDLVGAVAVEDLTFRGTYVGSGSVGHDIRGWGGPQPTVAVQAELIEIRTDGLAFDSASVDLQHRGGRYGSGQAMVDVWGVDAFDLHADLDFTLAPDRNSLVIQDLELVIDTVTWRTTQPAFVNWDGQAPTIHTLELASSLGGVVVVDGRLPIDQEADLLVLAEQVPLGNLGVVLRQDSLPTGFLTLEARIRGTLDAPLFQGSAAVLDAERNGARLPDTRASFSYAAQVLTLEADFLSENQLLAEMRTRLPIDLAVVNASDPRLLNQPFQLDLRVDSLSLEAIALFTDQITDPRGVISGDVAVGGTVYHPVFDGVLDLTWGAFDVELLGVRLENVLGTFRFEDQTVQIETLTAWSEGPVNVTGEIDIATLTRPVFDLEVEARNALVLDGENGRLRVDADLEVQGPIDAVVVTGTATTHGGVFYLPEPTGQNVISLDSPEDIPVPDTLGVIRLPEARSSTFLDNLVLEIDLFIEETWIRTSAANVEVSTEPEIGPLRIVFDRAAGQFTLEGTLNSDRGEYTFLGRRFEITRGAATFTGEIPVNPLIQIAAEHEVRLPSREAIRIRLVVEGSLAQPAITLESDAQPPIPETDLLSYLAFGRPASSLLQAQGSTLSGPGTASGDLAGNLAGLASLQLGGMALQVLIQDFERDLARSLGLDVFHISPADLPAELFTGGWADLFRGTQIEAGRYIQPRLFFGLILRPSFDVWPGAGFQYRSRYGLRWFAGVESRYLPTEPTLDTVPATRVSVFGAWVRREWRY